MKRDFRVWVEKHSINGPSPEILENEDPSKFVLLFLMEDSKLWFVANTEETKEEISEYIGQYYLVFRDELNKYFNKNFKL